MATNHTWLRSLLCYLFIAVIGYFSLTTISNDPISIVPKVYAIWKSYQNSRNPLLDAEINDTVLVLSWTNCWGWLRLDRMFHNCPPDLQCKVTCDRNLVDNSSAILFHVAELNWGDLPKKRRPDQYYIFEIWESPLRTVNLTGPGRRDFFNLTYTYRVDSSVFQPYGQFVKAPVADRNKTMIAPEKLLEVVRGKKHMAAWFVSNCGAPSGRDNFTRHLQTYVPVHVYGTCGSFSCPFEGIVPKTGMQDARGCHRGLTNDYWFYLSLENVICRDYITEKFYLPMDDSIVIPIVFERKLVLDTVSDPETKRALNKSFIAVDDFPNVAALANYMKYLTGNVTAYIEYFEWRKEYQIILDAWRDGTACGLCRVLHAKKRRMIEDVETWWIKGGNCHSYYGKKL